MPDWLSVTLLGIIEGITEFLPISSTGHLIIAERWLASRSELFLFVIQSGAMLAVAAIFAKRIRELLINWKDPGTRDYVFKLAYAFGLGCAGALAAKALGAKLPESTVPVAWATLIGGVVILGVELWLRGRPLSPQITWSIATAVGIAQVVAYVCPGTSRSGATILIAIALGSTRLAATEFSFLLGIPSILAAGGLQILSALKKGAPPEPWGTVALGTAVAAIVAFVVVKWLLQFVQTHTFTGFGWYRIALGAALLLFLR